MIELLVVIAIIGILAALLLPVLSATKARAQRTVCLNNLRQINLGVRMYSDDSADKAPSSPNSTNSFVLNFTGYKKKMKSYVGLNGASSTPVKLFACPADTFYYELTATNQTYIPQSLHDQAAYDYSSYWFNSGTPKCHRSYRGHGIIQNDLCPREAHGRYSKMPRIISAS